MVVRADFSSAFAIQPARKLVTLGRAYLEKELIEATCRLKRFEREDDQRNHFSQSSGDKSRREVKVCAAQLPWLIKKKPSSSHTSCLARKHEPPVGEYRWGIMQTRGPNEPGPRFTVEETIFLRGLAKGNTVKQIARLLRLPRESLFRVLGDLQNKTGMLNDTALAVWALRNVGSLDRRSAER